MESRTRFDIYDQTEMTMPVEYSAIKSAIIHEQIFCDII